MEIEFIKKEMGIGTHMMTYWFKTPCGQTIGLNGANGPSPAVVKLNGSVLAGAWGVGGIGRKLLEKYNEVNKAEWAG